MPKKFVTPILVIITILVFAYYGFNDNNLALTIFKLLFSVNILERLIKQLILFSRLSSIHDSLIILFQNTDIKSNTSKFESQILRHLLNYETTLSSFRPSISDNLFNLNNERLTLEWSEIKTKYQIN